VEKKYACQLEFLYKSKLLNYYPSFAFSKEPSIDLRHCPLWNFAKRI
jgi:hypothetical protein